MAVVGQGEAYPPLPIAAPPEDGYYVLTVKNEVSSWEVASGGGGGGFIAGGDLTGSTFDQTVVGLQGRPIANVMVSAGQIYVYNGAQWVPQSVPTGSFTAGGDLRGSDSNQTVQGLQTYAIQNIAPVSLAVPIWDTTNTYYDIRPLTQDDIAPGFSISSFTGGSTVETGTTVTNPSFTASYSHTPNSASITNTDGIDSPLTLTTPYTSGTVVGSFHHTTITSVTFTLTAIYTSTKSATQLISYLARDFGGVGAAGATSSVTASGNNAVLSTGDTLGSEGLFASSGSEIGQVFGPFTPSGQKVYLMLLGASHTFKDNVTGFNFVFNSPTTITFTNQHAAVVTMYLYESTNTLTGTFNVLVNS